MVICLQRGADLHTAQLMPLPLNVSCFSKIQTGFTFLVPAYQGSPGKTAVKRVYVRMYVSTQFNALSCNKCSINIVNINTSVCVLLCLNQFFCPVKYYNTAKTSSLGDMAHKNLLFWSKETENLVYVHQWLRWTQRPQQQPFNGLFFRTTWVSRYQNGKTNLDFTGARDSEWQWHQLGHMQVCTSLQTDNHASTPPLCFLQAGWPSCRPTNSVKALKANSFLWYNNFMI